MAEQRPVEPLVVGSRPITHPFYCPCSSTDRAPDFESVGCEFESRRGHFDCQMRTTPNTKPYIQLVIPILLAACYLLLAYPIAQAARNGPQTSVASPVMVVSPPVIEFTATLDQPQLLTQTITISNTGAETFTWTVTGNLSSTLWAGFSFSPTTGVNTGTIQVQLDSAAYTSTGVFTTTLWINAHPTSTVGSPFTVPISLHVLGLWHVYLPSIFSSPPPPPTNSITVSFGLSFITSAETHAGELRFQRAAQAGAGLDRWPFYWRNIETDPGVFDWSMHDPAVIADVEHSLQLNAILMIPPSFRLKGPCTGLAAQTYATPPRIGPAAKQAFTPALQQALAQNDCTTPADLDQPVFSDGTDILGIGKLINPNNPWATFVYATVMRYKPGGALATQQGWTANQGVRVWEVWNEPDYIFFWNGNVSDYARTMAVAYLAAKHADPEAQVLSGGLSDTYNRPNWLSDTLGIIATYPYTQTYGWYFDSVAVHSYSWSWASWRQLYLAQAQLDERGITGKTLWLNESGVPVWDDYPGPTWDPNSPYRATMTEQADYVIQSAIYAAWMKVEAVFHFQLYDDCGNGPDAHDAFGLRRNDDPAPCYPSDEGARPSFTAYQVASRYLGHLTPKWRWRPPPSGDPPVSGQEWIAFYDAAERTRLVALWSRVYTTQTAVLTATSASAVLVTPDGITQTLIAENGRYTLTLPAATNTNTNTGDGSAPIGGRPILLIEPDPSGTGGPKPIGLENKNPRLVQEQGFSVVHAGFEPAISALRGRRPRPLDEWTVCGGDCTSE